LWDEQIYKWLFARQTNAVMTLRSRSGDQQLFNYCFWNSINLNATPEGIVAGTIGFVAIQRNTYDYAQQEYIQNVKGYLATSGLYPGSFPPPFNSPGCANLTPAPGYKTKLMVDGSFVDFSSWSLNLSQEVVKFFACEVNTNPVEPKYIAVGPMQADFNCEYVYYTGTPQFTAQDSIAELDLYLFGEAEGISLKLKRMQRDTDSDDVQGQDEMVPLAATYRVYELGLAA